MAARRGRAAATGAAAIVVGGVPVEVERRRVRRLNLRVRADGTAHLSVPLGAEPDEARRFLEAHEAWLRAHVDRARERAGTPWPPADAEGRVPLWGSLARPAPGQSATDLYRLELAGRLPGVVSRMEAATGLHAASWSLRDMRSRWGSCTPSSGRVRLSVRLAAYPPRCLSYVVAHELTHLAEPGHGPRFHELLGRVVPDEREVRALLRRDPLELARAAGEPAGAPSDGGPLAPGCFREEKSSGAAKILGAGRAPLC